MRCTECRYSHVEELPILDKRVLYLDQNAFSVLFAVASGGRLPKGHEDFAREMHRRLKRIVLLQQAILPHSDIHRNETTVFRAARALRRAYEMIGGGVSFSDTHSIEQRQISEFASAFIAQREPALNFDVDAVLEDERNDWLPCQSASKKDPLSACKRDPSAEQHERYDGRSIRAGRDVGRA